MPNFGLTRAIRQAVLQGAKEAKVLRPGEVAANATRIDVKPGELIQEPAPATAPVAPSATPPPPEVPALTPTQANPGLATPPPAPVRGATPLPSADDALMEPAAIDMDAGRLATARPEDYNLEAIEQPNFDVITTTDEVKGVIADVSARNVGRIDEARRGVITNAQLQGLANDLDINQDVVRQVMERRSGGILNAETILAARQVLNSSAQRVQELGKKIASGGGSPLERLQFRRQLLWHADYQTQFMGARAEAGRALNAFSLPAGADVDINRVRDLVENLNGRDTDDLAKEVALIDSPAGVTKLAREYTQSKLMGTVNELFINSILSGPKTHIVNTAGNVLMQSMQIAETAVAARIGRFLGGEEHVAVGEATALAHGTISAWRDGLRLAARTARTGVALDDVVKFDNAPRRSISATNLMSAEQLNTPLGRFAEGLIDGVRIGNVPVPGIGPIIRAPTERVMMPTDEFFKTLAYRGELERQAYLHVADQINSGAATAADAAQLAREFMENAPLKAVQAAEEYTRYVTFQNSLGPVGQKFQLAIRSAPVLTLLAPFIRTPINIFKAGIIDRSPLGIFSKKFWRTMNAGGRERDMMLARVGMGTATTAVVASYVMSGDITGGGPQNPEARELLLASGWQPYSVKVDGKYVSYARAEPLAFVIGATADATEILSYINSDVEGLNSDEERYVYDAAAAIIVGVANNTMSKTFVRGISDFTELMSNPGMYLEGWTRNQVPAFIPYSSMRNQLGQIQDPYLREAWTVLDQIKVRSGIPGYSESAPPRRDILGNPRKAAAGDLMGPMSPFPSTDESTDPVVRELVNVMNATKTVPVSMPSKSVDKMRLSAAEYDELIKLSRLDPAPNGRTFYDELDYVMGSSVYLSATADMQAELLKDVQTRYDSIGRLKLERDNLAFAERLTEFRARRNRLRFGE